MNLQQISSELGSDFPIEKARAELHNQTDHQLPIIGRILMGIGGWLSAIFLCSFFGILLTGALELDLDAGGPLLVIGLILLVASVAASRATKNPFFTQMILAFSMAGFALAITGYLFITDSNDLGATLVSAILAIAIYLLSKNPLQKSSAIFFVAICYLIFELLNNWHTQNFNPFPAIIATVLIAVIISGLLKSEYWRPALYGLISGLYLLLYFVSRSAEINLSEAALRSTPALMMLASLVWLIKPKRLSSWLGIAVAFAVMTVISVLGGQGIAISLGIILCAHARNENGLKWLGIAGLIFFVIRFYYFLGVPLLDKSYILLGSGALLLILSWATKTLSTKQTTATV